MFFPSGCPAAKSGRAFPGLTYHGPTGLILVPTGQILANRQIAFGVHRGVLKAVYGFLGVAEMGIAGADMYDDPDGTAWKEDSFMFAKFGTEALAIKWWLPGIAFGAENSLADTDEGYYFSTTWHASIFSWPLEATIGGGTGRFDGHGYGAVGLIPAGLFGPTLKLLAELAGKQADLGIRLALARSLRLDFAMLFDTIPPDRESGRGWSVTIERGLPGTSMAADALSIFRAMIPEKKKKPIER